MQWADRESQGSSLVVCRAGRYKASPALAKHRSWIIRVVSTPLDQARLLGVFYPLVFEGIHKLRECSLEAVLEGSLGLNFDDEWISILWAQGYRLMQWGEQLLGREVSLLPAAIAICVGICAGLLNLK